MGEQKKKESSNPEKKLSRTTLTFYIIGLFTVALALILISYVAQERADRQLDTLTNQLNEQQTVAQGAAQKIDDLQKKLDVQAKALEKVRNSVDLELAETDVAGAVEQRIEEREVYALLAHINAQLLSDNKNEAKAAYNELVEKYGEERLLGNAKENAFDSDINKLFQAAKNEIKKIENEQKNK